MTDHPRTRYIQAALIGAVAIALVLQAAYGQELEHNAMVRRDVTPMTAPAAPVDHWNDEHQWLHIAGEAAVGASVYALTDSRVYAYTAAAVVGLGREEWKRQNGYANYNASRLFADIVGAVIGVEGARWFKDWYIKPHLSHGSIDGVYARYSREF